MHFKCIWNFEEEEVAAGKKLVLLDALVTHLIGINVYPIPIWHLVWIDNDYDLKISKSGLQTNQLRFLFWSFDSSPLLSFTTADSLTKKLDVTVNDL